MLYKRYDKWNDYQYIGFWQRQNGRTYFLYSMNVIVTILVGYDKDHVK